MRPRGSILAAVLAALAVIAAAAVFLAQTVQSRAQAQTTAAQREAALRQAEDALELACAALRQNKLAEGGSTGFAGTSVSCQRAENGLKLEAAVWIHQPAGTKIRRRVRLTWFVSHPHDQGPWVRSGWQAKDETAAP